MKLIVAIMLTLALAFSASADSTCWTTANPELTIADHYVDSDPCQPDCFVSVWIYEESNGLPGLQRGDMVLDNVMACGPLVPADTYVNGLIAGLR